MKQIIALALCLLMMASLAACGGAAADDGSVSAGHEETTEAAAEIIDQTEALTAPAETQPPETKPAETKPAETQPAFDTSWASNDLEKLIPKPPFDGWTVKSSSAAEHKLETSKANADGTGAYYDTWDAYIQTLKDCGFTVKGDTYKAECTDPAGNRVELQCGDGYAWITIRPAKAK